MPLSFKVWKADHLSCPNHLKFGRQTIYDTLIILSFTWWVTDWTNSIVSILSCYSKLIDISWLQILYQVISPVLILIRLWRNIIFKHSCKNNVKNFTYFTNKIAHSSTIFVQGLVRFMVFNATFNNISAISWLSALLVEETWGSGENHRPVASHWQTLSHNVVSSTHNISGDRHWLHR